MRVANIFGIKVILNPWFLLLLLLYIVLDIWIQAVGVFLVVIWHELWHCIVAWLNGMKVREIELLPFGGVARLEGFLEGDGNVEAKIALAGPLSNFFLASIIALALTMNLFYHPLAYFLFLYNMVIGIFNLLPTLPLDGGRVLRGWLSKKIGVLRATRLVAKLGQVVAGLLLVAGIAGTYYQLVDFHVAIIAVFIWLGALKEREEAFYMHWRSLLQKNHRFLKESVFMAQSLVARADVELKQILPKLMTNKYNMIIVIDQSGEMVGTISEEKLFKVITDRGHDVKLQQIID